MTTGRINQVAILSQNTEVNWPR